MAESSSSVSSGRAVMGARSGRPSGRSPSLSVRLNCSSVHEPRPVASGVAKDGRYTPPWMVKLPLLSDEDLKDVIAFLRSDDPMAVSYTHLRAHETPEHLVC